MTGQVIYLNTWLDIPKEQRDKHDQIQALICQRLAEFMYETRDYNAFQRSISKQKSHHLWRNRMSIVVDNGINDLDDSIIDD
jgi:hypothetical protein